MCSGWRMFRGTTKAQPKIEYAPPSTHTWPPTGPGSADRLPERYSPATRTAVPRAAPTHFHTPAPRHPRNVLLVLIDLVLVNAVARPLQNTGELVVGRQAPSLTARPVPRNNVCTAGSRRRLQNAREPPYPLASFLRIHFGVPQHQPPRNPHFEPPPPVDGVVSPMGISNDSEGRSDYLGADSHRLSE